MAVVSNPKDFADTDIKVGPKTMTVAFYILVGVIAAGIAIPAAFMTADAGLFEECYAAAAACGSEDSTRTSPSPCRTTRAVSSITTDSR